MWSRDSTRIPFSSRAAPVSAVHRFQGGVKTGSTADSPNQSSRSPRPSRHVRGLPGQVTGGSELVLAARGLVVDVCQAVLVHAHTTAVNAGLESAGKSGPDQGRDHREVDGDPARLEPVEHGREAAVVPARVVVAEEHGAGVLALVQRPPYGVEPAHGARTRVAAASPASSATRRAVVGPPARSRLTGLGRDPASSTSRRGDDRSRGLAAVRRAGRPDPRVGAPGPSARPRGRR